MSTVPALTEEITIVNRLGLHTRAAAKFVRLASQFKSHVTLMRNGETVNGKSIMGILMLAAGKGEKVTIHVAGADQETAFVQLKELIATGFGER